MLTTGLRLALAQLEEMVRSYQTAHPMPNWLQHKKWQDADRELLRAGFVQGSIAPAYDLYAAEREAARRSQHLSSPVDGVGPLTGSISKGKSV